MNTTTAAEKTVKVWDLTDEQRKVLCYACDKCGAAVWLWPAAVETLSNLGLVEPAGAHAVRATEKGRQTWFMY